MVGMFSSRVGEEKKSKGAGNALPSMPIDLVAIVWRRKYVVITSVAVAVVLGTALTWASPPLYRYVSAIQIGDLVGHTQGVFEKNIVPLEKQGDVVFKLRNIYIPLATTEYFAKHPAKNYQYRVRVEAVAGGNVIWLHATGPKRYESGYISIMQSAINRIIKDDESIVRPFRTQYRASEGKARIRLQYLRNEKIFDVRVMKLKNAVLQAQSRLEKLKVAARVMRERAERYNKEVRLVGREIKHLATILVGQRKNRGEALKEINSPERAMMLMAIDNSSNPRAEWLFHLRRQRDVILPSAKQELLGKIAENQLTQVDEKQEISVLRTHLISLYASHRNQIAAQEQVVAFLGAQVAQQRSTAVLQVPVRLARSVGPHRLGRAVLAAIGGLTFGIIVAFILELWMRRKHGQSAFGNPTG